MEKFRLITDQVKEKENQQKINSLFSKIAKTYPQLNTAVKWNQPTLTDHGTFITAFSFAKNHFSIAPEKAAIRALEKTIQEVGYIYTDSVIKVPRKSAINWEPTDHFISFNIGDKKDHNKFWRQSFIQAKTVLAKSLSITSYRLCSILFILTG